jgi:cytochrome c-type biogenesis protein CcmF
VITVGRVAIGFSLAFSLAAILFIVLGVRQRSRDLVRNGYIAVYGFFLSTAVAFAVLLQAFLNKDFGFQYVWQYSDATLSTFYRVAGVWAGQEGSFLLWLALLAIVTVVIALRNVNDSDDLTATAVALLCGVSAFFAVLMVFDKGSNPFLANTMAGVPPQGLGPLLLHPAMVLHPPTLFMGYAWLTVPFAYGMAAVILRRPDSLWVKLTQKWTVVGWLLLSLGIGLGAWWAYVVLSFGGYWGWDAVENTSLIPWLTATALLHSSSLYIRQGIFKRWTLGLAVGTFWLTIVATWVTRSGMISSVHAFEHRTLLVQLLSGFLIVIAAGSAALIASRWRRFAVDRQVESATSRDFLYYLTNLLLTLFAAALLFGTVVYPLITGHFKYPDAPGYSGRSVMPVTYDRFARPLGVLVLFGLAVCPLLSWRGTDGATLWRRLRVPLAAALVSVPVLVFTGPWRHSIGGLLGLVVCVFALFAVLQSIYDAARRAARDRGLFTGLGRALTFSRSRTGGWVAHLGMVLVVTGLLGSNVYKIAGTAYVSTKAGTQATVDGYTLRFVGFREDTGPQNAQRTFATYDVFKGGAKVGTLAPHTDIYPPKSQYDQGQAAVRAVIMGTAGQDLFVSPSDTFDAKSKFVSLQVDVFPLIRYLWIGALMLVGGAVVSLWPRGGLAAAGEPAAETDVQ